jgi:hypothetical protein
LVLNYQLFFLYWTDIVYELGAVVIASTETEVKDRLRVKSGREAWKGAGAYLNKLNRGLTMMTPKYKMQVARWGTEKISNMRSRHRTGAEAWSIWHCKQPSEVTCVVAHVEKNAFGRQNKQLEAILHPQ